MDKHCMICEKLLKQVLLTEEDSVTEGTTWITEGGYGSSLFDSIPFGNPEHLELFICDPCLKNRQHLVHYVVSQNNPTEKRQLWQPEKIENG